MTISQDKTHSSTDVGGIGHKLKGDLSLVTGTQHGRCLVSHLSKLVGIVCNVHHLDCLTQMQNMSRGIVTSLDACDVHSVEHDNLGRKGPNGSRVGQCGQGHHSPGKRRPLIFGHGGQGKASGMSSVRVVHRGSGDVNGTDHSLDIAAILHGSDKQRLALFVLSTIHKTRHDATDTLDVVDIFHQKLKGTIDLVLLQIEEGVELHGMRKYRERPGGFDVDHELVQ